MDTLKGRIAAMFAMAACCGTAMAIALGAIVISSTWIIGGIAFAIAATCVLFMIHMGHGHGHHHNQGNPVATVGEYDRVS